MKSVGGFLVSKDNVVISPC